MCDQQTPMEKYRASFSLMNRKARGCKQGCTIRGAHSYVCMGKKLRSDCNSLNGNINTCKTGMAKFGPTADTSSRMARIKQIQNRVIRKTPTNKGTFSGTKRGPHSSVNEKTLLFDQEPFYPQLFGKRKLTNLSGNKGTSGDYLYFKSVIPRMAYNGNISGCSVDIKPSKAQLAGKILVVSTKAGATKLDVWNAALWGNAPWATMAKFWAGTLVDADLGGGLTVTAITNMIEDQLDGSNAAVTQYKTEFNVDTVAKLKAIINKKYANVAAFNLDVGSPVTMELFEAIRIYYNAISRLEDAAAANKDQNVNTFRQELKWLKNSDPANNYNAADTKFIH